MKKYNVNKILVTGSSGYITSNLIKKINSNSGDIVVGLTRRPTGYRHINYIEIISNLSNDNFIKDLKSQKKINIVLHFVQSSKYRDFPNEAEDIFNVNINSTLKLLEWSRKEKIDQFIFASTGNVYGQKKSFLNEDSKCSPDSFYGASKLISELLINQYSSFFKTTILRIFGVYGPNQKKMLVHSMTNKIKNGDVIKLNKGIGLIFTPIFIDDCLEMIRLVLERKKSGIYNICGNDEVKLIDMIKIISFNINKDYKIEVNEEREQYFCGSNNLFYKKFGYKPKISIKKGIKLILDKK